MNWVRPLSSAQAQLGLMLARLGRLVCQHDWVRARWEDGTYGLRCQFCMKRYRHTWNDLLDRPEPIAVSARHVAGRAGIPFRLATPLQRASSAGSPTAAGVEKRYSEA